MGELVHRVEEGDSWVEFRASQLFCEKCGQMIVHVNGSILETPIDVPARFPAIGNWCPACFGKWMAERDNSEWNAAQQDHACRSIPTNLKSACFDNFDHGEDQDAFQAVWIWAKNPKGNLILWGKPGNGKSHLGVAALKQILVNSVPNRMMRTVEFIKVYALIDKLRRAQRDSDDDPPPGHYAPQDYAVIPNLILDDVGVERPTEFCLESLYGILDTRLERSRPTLITSNLHPDKVGERLGDRLASRIFSGKVIEMKGRDRRLLRPV